MKLSTLLLKSAELRGDCLITVRVTRQLLRELAEMAVDLEADETRALERAREAESRLEKHLNWGN